MDGIEDGAGEEDLLTCNHDAGGVRSWLRIERPMCWLSIFCLL